MFRVLSSLFIASILIPQNAGYAISSEARHFVVPKVNMKYFGANKPVVLAQSDELNLVQLVPFQVETLSRELHHHKAICGGFQDVEVQMEKQGLTPTQALQWLSTRQRSLTVFDKTELTQPTEAKLLMGSISIDRFVKALTAFSAFPDRHSRSELGLKASQWLADTTKKMALDHGRNDITVTSIATTSSWFVQSSVVVKIEGADSKLPGIVVGGHMDTFQNNKPGADDDGSGSMSVMEIYNAVLDSDMHFKRDVYFAFYAAEEYGLYGSQSVAAEFKKQNIPLRAILQFDMTGFKSPRDTKEIYLINDYVDVNLTDFLRKLTIQYLQIPANMIGETRCGYACSDHASWTETGYASSFPFETSFENYNKTLHTSEDKMALITPAHALKYLLLGAAFVAETAEPISF